MIDGECSVTCIRQQSFLTIKPVIQVPCPAARSYMRIKISNQTTNYYECDKVLPSAQEFLAEFDVQRFIVFAIPVRRNEVHYYDN